MPRKTHKARRLVVGEATYLWSVRHNHHIGDGPRPGCAESLVVRRHGARGSVRITFAGGPGRAIPDGLLPSGVVGTGGGYLNLHKPGTARALLDEALARGWNPDDPPARLLDGWDLFAAALARREPH